MVLSFLLETILALVFLTCLCLCGLLTDVGLAAAVNAGVRKGVGVIGVGAGVGAGIG